MRPRSKTILLAGVAASLAAYIALHERGQQTTDQLRASRHLLVIGLQRNEVQGLRFARGGSEFTLSRGAAGWTITPGGEEADGQAMDRLLSALESAEVDRTLDPTVASGTLRAGVLRVTVVTARSERVLELGEPDGSGRGVYVRVDGGPVRVTELRVRQLADRTREGWREGRVLALAPEHVTQVEWRRGGETHVMRRQSGGWVDGQGAWLVDERVQLALTALLHLHGEHVESPLAAATGDAATGDAATPPAELSLRLTGAGVLTELRVLEHGCADGRPLVLHGASHQCLDTTAPTQALEMAAAPDLRVAGVVPAQVTAVTLAEGERRLELRRGRGGWSAAGGAGAPIGADETESWLEQLCAIDAQAGRAPAVLPSSRARTVVLTTSGGQRTLEVARDGGRVLVRRSGEPRALVAPAALWDLVMPEARAFRPRLLLAVSRFDVQRVKVTGAGPVQEIARRGDDWQVTQPANRIADPAAVDGLLDVVTEVRAERFTGESFAPERTVELEEALPATGANPVPGRTRLHRLELGRTRAGGCPALLSSSDAPSFLLAPDACSRLARSLAK